MNANYLASLSLLTAVCLAGCVSAQEPSNPPQLSELEQSSESTPDTASNDLIIESDLDAVGSDWNDILSVQQVSDESAFQTEDFAFAAVEGDHPCMQEEAVAEECSQKIERLADEVELEAATSDFALSEIQALTPNVVDPQTFDPTQTAQDLGRSPRPQTQAGQAVGFQLLQPAPIPVEPEEDPTDPTAGDLPPVPVILDGQ